MADLSTNHNGGGSSSNGEGEQWSLLPQLQPLAPILSRQTSGASQQYASLGVASPAPSDGASSIASPCLRRKRPRQLQGNAALTINVLTALWGPAVFAMPWAFQEAGLAAGAIGVVAVAAFSFTTLTLLIRTKRLFSDGLYPSDAAAAAAATAAAGVEGGDATPPTPFMYGAVVSPIVMGEGTGRNGQPEDGDGDEDEEKQRTQAALLHKARRQQQAWRGEELTYAQVAARALGRHASGLVKGATTISCLGACAAYLSFIVGMIVQLAPQWGEERVLLAFFPLLVLLSWVRGFRRLSFLNVLGNLSLLGGVLAIFYDGFAHGHHRNKWSSFSEIVAAGPSGGKGGGEAIRWVSPGTLLLFFGPTAFLFVIHYCAVPIESEAADPKEFTPALARSMALTAVLDIVVGCAGYWFYGQEPLVRDPSGRVLPGCERNVCDNVLKNVEAGPVKSAIIVVFTINLVLAFEVMLIPPREYVERWLIKPSRPYYRLLPTKWQRNLTRTLLVLVTFAVAFSMKNFGLLTGFVGAITDTLQGFVLPPLIYAAAHKATIAPAERAALLAMSVLGVLLMLTATYQNAGELQRLLLRRAEAT